MINNLQESPLNIIFANPTIFRSRSKYMYRTIMNLIFKLPICKSQSVNLQDSGHFMSLPKL